jgi:hypothetical protein
MTHSNSPDDRDAEVTRRLHDLDAHLDALFTADRDDPQRIAAFRAELARRLDATGPTQAASPASPTADQPHAAAAASNRSTTADPWCPAGLHDVRERLMVRSHTPTAFTRLTKRIPSLELPAVSLALVVGLLSAGLLWLLSGDWIWLGIPIGLGGVLFSLTLRSILSPRTKCRARSKSTFSCCSWAPCSTRPRPRTAITQQNVLGGAETNPARADEAKRDRGRRGGAASAAAVDRGDRLDGH